MLQEIRNKSQGWIAKTIIGVIVLLFALTGFEAIFRALGHDNEVATINGEALSKVAFDNAYEQQRYILSSNGQFDGSPEAVQELKKLVMANLVNYQILVQAAANAGFGYLPEGFVKQIILSDPSYQINGRFDNELFNQSIRNYGYASDRQFVQDLLEQMFLAQLQSGIVKTAFSTDGEVLAIAKLLDQTRDFSYKELKASDVTSVTQQEITAWYEKNKDTLKTPEQVILEYIELNKADFTNKVTVSDQELKDRYAKKIVDLENQPARKRIAHILIPVTANQTDAQAKLKIDEIAKELKEGKDFSVLAKQNSQDLGTSNNGGDLGFLTIDDLPDQQALAPVVTKLEKVGEISDPVRSQFGWHIIKLTDLQKVSIPSFASLQDQLTTEIKQQKTYDAYLNAQRDLDKLAYESYDSLSSVANQLKLTLELSKAFARDTGYDALTKNEKVIKAAFSENLLKGDENSTIIELTPDSSVVIRVKEHLEPAMMTIEQATPLITKTLQTEKVRAEGEQLITELKAGKGGVDKSWLSFNGIQQPLKMQLLGENLKQAVPPEIVDKLFTTPQPVNNKPAFQGFTTENGNYVILALTKVNEFEGVLTDEQKNQYQTLITTDAANKFWAEYQQYLKDKADIKYLDLE